MIRRLIDKARKRLFLNELLSRLAIAGALVAAGLILLLLAGTRILDWQFPVVLGLGGLAFAFITAIRRRPSLTAAALRLDQGAGLHDSLSTALHFENADHEAARDAQRRQAEALIPGIDLTEALPMHTTRAVYWMAGLFLAASALFALRFGLNRQLDLRPTLAHAVMDSLGMTASQPAKQAPQPKPRRSDFLAKLGIHLPEGAETSAMNREQPGQAPASDSSVTPPQNAAAAPGAQMADGKQSGNDHEAANQKSDQQEGGDPNQPGNKPGSPGGSKEGEGKGEPSAKQQKPEGDQQSLVSKMKDALNNLMAKAKQQAAEGGAQQKAGGQQPGEKKPGAQQQAKGGQKGQPGEGQQQGAQESSSDDAAQAGKAGDAKDQANGKGSDQQQSAQAGSGVGKQDGSKDLKAAEQLNAMGKLSNIIGKRSQNVSGEMMLDTQSGPQHLSTAYTHSAAQHSDTGGDLNRNEIPLAMQSYVQKYFEQVRKQDAAPRHKAAVAPKTQESVN